MRTLLAIGLAGLLGASPAIAQHQFVLDRLGQLNAKAPQPPMVELVSAAALTAKAYGDANKVCVPTAIELNDVAPITGAREVLSGVLSGQLRNAWTGFAKHVGCADAGVTHYLFVQKASGQIDAAIVSEGETLANPTLIRDMSAQAALSAVRKAKSLDAKCTGDPIKMGRTRVVARSKDLGPEYYGARYTGNWTEAWQFKTCGRTFEVPVEFRPDGDGGAFTKIKGDAVAVIP